jgi:hypothetical protein
MTHTQSSWLPLGHNRNIEFAKHLKWSAEEALLWPPENAVKVFSYCQNCEAVQDKHLTFGVCDGFCEWNRIRWSPKDYRIVMELSTPWTERTWSGRSRKNNLSSRLHCRFLIGLVQLETRRLLLLWWGNFWLCRLRYPRTYWWISLKDPKGTSVWSWDARSNKWRLFRSLHWIFPRCGWRTSQRIEWTMSH